MDPRRLTMLHLIQSNTVERLESEAMDLLATGPEDPLVPLTIVTPGFGLRQRLRLACARRFGIAANLEFHYLAEWLWSMARRVDRTLPDRSPFDVPRLQWRLYRMLGDASSPALTEPRLGTYLEHADHRMRFELACTLASLYDTYATHRPEWLHAWSMDHPASLADVGDPVAADVRWQAALWKQITDELGHFPFRIEGGFFQACAALTPGRARRAGFPERVLIHCPADMTALHVRMLDALAQWIDIHVLVLNPCREYWFDIVEERRLSWLVRHGRAEHHETINPLLASWGRQTQGLLSMLLGDTDPPPAGEDVMVDDDRRTVLSAIRNAMLRLEPFRGHAPLPPDDSIEVHACHSITRQLEVLHNRLHALFTADPTLTPGDVLVVTPDLAVATPLIEAVFGGARDARWIDHRVTGQAEGRDNTAAAALCAILDLLRSRFEAPAVFEVVQLDAVARSFDLDPGALDRIRSWMQSAGFRWGVDAAHRSACGLPATGNHTLDDAMQRLFLGYAMPEHATAVVAGMLPVSEPVGAAGDILGRFAAFTDALIGLRDHAATSHPPAAWCETLHQLTDRFITMASGEEDDLRRLLDLIDDVCSSMAEGGVEDVPLDVVRAALDAALQESPHGARVSGAVTFTAMAQLRCVPHRVICLLGMDDDAWPTRQPRTEFDLIPHSPPRRGDRNRQAQDRSILLDLLLAARDRLIITYTGSHIRQNTILPPSVLIAELLDAMTDVCLPPDADARTIESIRNAWTRRHPLQGFSPRHFADPAPGMESVDADACDAARAVERRLACVPGPDARPFFTAPLPAPDADTFGIVTIDDLVGFLRNTSRHFLLNRLRVRLPWIDAGLEDQEPLTWDRNHDGGLTRRLLPEALAGADAERLITLAMAGIEAPAGELGRGLIEERVARTRAVVEKVVHLRGHAQPRSRPFDIPFTLDGEIWRVQGTLDSVCGAGLVQVSPSQVHEDDLMRAWVPHLVLNHLGADGAGRTTQRVTLDRTITLHEVNRAGSLLMDLLTLYREGLMRPVRFFLRSSIALCRPEGSMAKARDVWSDNEFIWTEATDPHHAMAMRGVDDPLGGEFEEVSRRILTPLFDVLIEEKT